MTETSRRAPPRPPPFKTGFVTIIGRPNVGKSTLLNHLVEQKISIVTRKPQTTRCQVRGIKTTANYQVIYTDTPGYQGRRNNAINRYMNREALRALADVDAVLFVVEAVKWSEGDARVARLLRQVKTPLALVINKLDLLQDRRALLPYIARVRELLPFAAVLPLSARRRRDIALLERNLVSMLPEGAPLFPEDQATDRSERFITAEYIREKATLRLGAELPYKISVTVEEFNDDKDLLSIYAVIWTERAAHRSIVIGEKGARLKSIGAGARRDLEKLFGKKVYLHTRVKTKENWTEDAKALKTLGYN